MKKKLFVGYEACAQYGSWVRYVCTITGVPMGAQLYIH